MKYVFKRSPIPGVYTTGTQTQTLRAAWHRGSQASSLSTALRSLSGGESCLLTGAPVAPHHLLPYIEIVCLLRSLY